MLDQRITQVIDLTNAEILKENVAYKYTDSYTGKELVVKTIGDYYDDGDVMLMAEFRKLALLSSQPEIATVYFLAKAKILDLERSCYVMDFVLGYDLDEFINSHEHINYNVIFNIISQIASGLEKAHHYDIFHNDLHNKNIRINTLGYVKIIDFLWTEHSKDKRINLNKDLQDFKRIVAELSAKCEVDMTDRISITSTYCQNINSFTDLSSTLIRLNDLSFSLSLLGNTSFPILSKLVYAVKDIPTKELLHSVEVVEEAIPLIYIADRTEAEEEYLKKNREYDERKLHMEKEGIPIKGTLVLGLRYSDSRIYAIKNLIDFQLLVVLSPVEKAGFINFEANVINNGETLEGPYYLLCQIYFTSKFAELREFNRNAKIISDTQASWLNLLLDTPVTGLEGHLPLRP